MRVTELEDTVRSHLAAGDVAAAATEAIRGLAPQVLRYQRAVLRDDDEAADAFASFAESVWAGLPRFEWRTPLRVWALRIACNAALDLRKQAWRRRGRRLETTEASRLAAELHQSSFVRAEARERTLETLRASLSPEEQHLLVLRIDQGLHWDEIAAVLADGPEAASPATLMKRYERLKTRLAQLAREASPTR